MSIQELQTSRLDINNNYEIDVTFKQLDDIVLKIVVYDKILPADLSNYTARLKAFKSDQVPLIQNTQIYINDNEVTIKGDPQLGTTSGIVKAELQFINKTTLEKKSSFYININVVASVLETDRGISIATCTLLKEIDNKLDQIENIDNILDDAIEVNNELKDTTILAANVAKNNLESSIDDANIVNLALDQSKTNADNLKIALDESIDDANNAKIALGQSKTNADDSKAALEVVVQEANQFVQDHQDIIDLDNRVDLLAAQTSDIAVNVKSFGAKGDGTTDDTVAIQNALDYCGLHNKPCYIPNGIYLITTINMGNCKTLIGNGRFSILMTTTSANIMVNVGLEKSYIANLFFLGDKLNQYGIMVDGKYNCKIYNCVFKDVGLGGDTSGVYFKNIGTSQHTDIKDGGTVTNCEFYGCWHGVHCGTNGEYVNILDCQFQEQTTWAIWTTSGNTIINGCNIVKCKNGIYITGSNGGHSMITATNINHIYTDNGDGTYTSGYGLFIDSITLGQVITGCAMFDCSIMLRDSVGIQISNSILSIVNYDFENSVGEIKDCYIRTAYGHVINNYINNKPSFIQWTNIKTFDNNHISILNEIQGGMVTGTINAQSVANDANPILAITATTKSANYASNPKFDTSWWDSATYKTTNKGYGGNRIKINVQFSAQSTGAGDIKSGVAWLLVGTKRYYLSSSYLLGTTCYYSFSGEIACEPNTAIYLMYYNKTGQSVNILTTNSIFEIEGL